MACVHPWRFTESGEGLTTNLALAEVPAELGALTGVRFGKMGLPAANAVRVARTCQAQAAPATADMAPSQRRRGGEAVVSEKLGLIGGTRSSWLGLG